MPSWCLEISWRGGREWGFLLPRLNLPFKFGPSLNLPLKEADISVQEFIQLSKHGCGNTRRKSLQHKWFPVLLFDKSRLVMTCHVVSSQVAFCHIIISFYIGYVSSSYRVEPNFHFLSEEFLCYPESKKLGTQMCLGIFVLFYYE